MRDDSAFSNRMRCGMILALLAALASPAAAADGRWQEGAGGAVAILPPPVKATGIVGGSLSCAEQRWTLILRTEPGAVPAGTRARARLVTGDDSFEADATAQSGTLQIAVPRTILEPLKAASRLGVSVGDKGALAKALFSLAGSQKVLEAIAARCTPIEMSGYDAVSLADTAPSVATASDLMKDEAKTFRAATGKTPAYASAMIELNGGRRLMFASLCGIKTNYYGPSGCTLRGYAADTPDAAWREVYATEGMALYTDARTAKDGWPGLAALPAGGDAAIHWTWSGDAYVVSDPQGAPLQSVADKGDTSSQ